MSRSENKPPGMMRRGRVWYWRRKIAGREIWRALGTDAREAIRQARELDRRHPQRTGHAERISMDELFDRWLEVYVATYRTAKNQAVARQRVDDYLRPALGHLSVSTLKRDHIRRFRVVLETQPRARGEGTLSVQTVAHILSDLRCCLRWAQDAGYIDAAPIPARMLPRIPRAVPDALSEEEVAAICGLPDPHGFVCRLGIATGLRWSDLRRLTAEQLRGGALEVATAKTGVVVRIPIPPDIVEAIRARVGLLVPYSNAGNFARVVRRRSGVEDYHVHRMRHTFARRWLDRGGSVEALQRMLGHGSIRTTERYARMSDRTIDMQARQIFSHGVARA